MLGLWVALTSTIAAAAPPQPPTTATATPKLALARSAATPLVVRSERRYELPPVQLLDSAGKTRRLNAIVDDGRPVVLTFMYSSCTTVCPVTSQIVSEFSRLLGADAKRVNLVSISIDPDHDTVARLAEHARTARLSGAFYTGDPAAAEAVERAFEAWWGDKMNHEPVFFLRTPGRPTWVRLDGFVSPQRLLAEFRLLGAS